MIYDIQFFGGRGASSGGGNTYTRGSTTYSITGEGNKVYLRMQTGSITDKVKIAYANDENKARVTIPHIGILRLKDEPGLLRLLRRRN